MGRGVRRSAVRGPPGWGPPGWGAPQPPQAPKPGVIPLQPLQLSDILNGAVSTVGRYWKQLLGMAAAVYGGAAAIIGVALAILYASLSGRIHGIVHAPEASDVTWDQAGPVVLGFSAVLLAAGLLSMVCTALVHATCATVLREAVLGRPTTFRAVWRRAWSRVFPVIGTVLLSGLIVLVPLLLIAGASVAVVVAAVGAHNPAVAIVVGVVGGLALLPAGRVAVGAPQPGPGRRGVRASGAGRRAAPLGPAGTGRLVAGLRHLAAGPGDRLHCGLVHPAPLHDGGDVQQLDAPPGHRHAARARPSC